jgi:16S rRNA (guanine1207-N2)-methyltransferase
VARRKKSLPPIPKPILAREEKKLQVPPVEQALIDALRTHEFESAVVWTAGRGQLAADLGTRGTVKLLVMDAWDLSQCQQFLENRAASSVSVLCQSDWPDGVADLAAIALDKSGSEELALELFQSAWLGLRPGGTLAVSIHRDSERWLGKSLKVFSTSVSSTVFGDSIVMSVQSTGELKRVRDWKCELAFRDTGNLVRLVTRPGVFAHRKMDNGARQLLNCIQLEADARVLDIGCGSGAVALGLATRDRSVDVLAVDSHVRAIECTRLGAELNGLENVTTLLSHEGDFGTDGTFDVALGNPPYYSSFKIAEIFCETALRNLRPGGRAIFVSKSPVWYETNLPRWFGDVEVFESGSFHIATGLVPPGA